MALSLSHQALLPLCMCVCVGEGELCAISGLNFKRSSNFHTIFRLRSFALSWQRRSLSGSVCTSQQPIPAAVPCPLPLSLALPWLTVLCSLALVQSLTVAAPSRVVLFTSSPAPVATFATEIFQTLATRQAWCGERWEVCCAVVRCGGAVGWGLLAEGWPLPFGHTAVSVLRRITVTLSFLLPHFRRTHTQTQP